MVDFGVRHRFGPRLDDADRHEIARLIKRDREQAARIEVLESALVSALELARMPFLDEEDIGGLNRIEQIVVRKAGR